MIHFVKAYYKKIIKLICILEAKKWKIVKIHPYDSRNCDGKFAHRCFYPYIAIFFAMSV